MSKCVVVGFSVHSTCFVVVGSSTFLCGLHGTGRFLAVVLLASKTSARDNSFWDLSFFVWHSSVVAAFSHLNLPCVRLL